MVEKDALILGNYSFTVKPRHTTAPLIRPPRYYDLCFVVRTAKAHLLYSLKTPLIRPNFHGPTVVVITGLHCTHYRYACCAGEVIPRWGGGRVGSPQDSWRGRAARFSKSCPYFRPKHAIFHTRVQTWPGRLQFFHWPCCNVIKLGIKAEVKQ